MGRDSHWPHNLYQCIPKVCDLVFSHSSVAQIAIRLQEFMHPDFRIDKMIHLNAHWIGVSANTPFIYGNIIIPWVVGDLTWWFFASLRSPEGTANLDHKHYRPNQRTSGSKTVLMNRSKKTRMQYRECTISGFCSMNHQ